MLSLFLVIVLFLFIVFSPRNDEIEKACTQLRGIEHGNCPKCSAAHPDAAKHSGNDDFWTTFTCPECGYSTYVHVAKQRNVELNEDD